MKYIARIIISDSFDAYYSNFIFSNFSDQLVIPEKLGYKSRDKFNTSNNII